jgi:hypothetical protein
MGNHCTGDSPSSATIRVPSTAGGEPLYWGRRATVLGAMSNCTGGGRSCSPRGRQDGAETVARALTEAPGPPGREYAAVCGQARVWPTGQQLVKRARG